MICSKKDRKKLANVEELLEKEIPRANFTDDEAISVDEIENADPKSKSRNNAKNSTDYEKDRQKNTKNYQKYENNKKIVGLGEHTPGFLSQSFSDRLAS